MVQDHQISKAKACKIVGFSRSAFYKSTVDWAAKDAPVIDALNEIIAKRARWGFWKCFHRLRSDGHVSRVRHQMTQVVDSYRSPYFFTTTKGSVARF